MEEEEEGSTLTYDEAQVKEIHQIKLKRPFHTSNVASGNNKRLKNGHRRHRRSHKRNRVSKQVHEDSSRYLMYVPYAGVTNQLISIWHGSMIAKALNRTLLIPNLSPNVHIAQTPSPDQESSAPTATKWSEFFDLEYYSQRTGLQIEELDGFLERKGIVEQSSVLSKVMGNRRVRLDVSKDLEDDRASAGHIKRNQRNQRRWIQLQSVTKKSPLSPSLSLTSRSSGSPSYSRRKRSSTTRPRAEAKAATRTTRSQARTTLRFIKYPTAQKCISEAGYGFDRRIDMTGRQFMQRYNIDPSLIPTPFLDPDNDNKTLWSRLRMDKLVERYLQPEYEQQEILCLGHVYRLLPGGRDRAWVEFGQHFHYTKSVDSFVDEILGQLLSPSLSLLSSSPMAAENIGSSQSGSTHDETDSNRPTFHDQPFIGIHLRRGDFERHCLGITSPADFNGWNRCYPSTGHIISLLNTYGQQQMQRQQDRLSSANVLRLTDSRLSGTHSLPHRLHQRVQQPHQHDSKDIPVLVLTNERDPEELAKADAQNWIRVDHKRLGTLERYGEYGPILIDGALLARAHLLVGVEYSTYFKTAGKRAESWYGGETLFVT
ncbi:hypothetical protein BGX34_009221 [Mortierella sp. NVP85]|nr:hypothetical protein BGX34_009221 [Mortierella sp. NVP85]